MADKSISELTQALQINDSDLFVLEQNGEAKKMLMALWKDYISRNVVSASASQLPAGSQPTATFNATTGALVLGIPQGKKGDTGATGATGPQGSPGTDGVTPHIGGNGNWFLGDTDTGVAAIGQDGSDYVLTDADKSEIAALVLAQIPDGDEVAYG